jgi:hypothetical protein
MPEMDVFLAEGLCFDASMEGNGGPWGGVPHCAKVSAGWPCAIGPEICSILQVDFREFTFHALR